MTNQDNKNGLETKIVKGPATGDTTQEQENKPKCQCLRNDRESPDLCFFRLSQRQ